MARLTIVLTLSVLTWVLMAGSAMLQAVVQTRPTYGTRLSHRWRPYPSGSQQYFFHGHFSGIIPDPSGLIFAHESFRLIRPNLREVRARTDPDLASLVIFYKIQL